jgi:hypothetical protein
MKGEVLKNKSSTNGKIGIKGEDGYLFIRNQSTNEFGFGGYDLKITKFDIIGEINDLIFEPNEKIIIKNIEYQNVGQISLPKGISITIDDLSSNFETNNDEIKIIEGLKKNEKRVLKEELSGNLIYKETDQIINNNMNIQSEIILRAKIGLNEFPQKAKQIIKLEHPIKIEKIKSKNVISSDESFDIEIQIKNISSMSYGKNSNSQRRIFINLVYSDDDFIINQKKFEFLDNRIEIEEIQSNIIKFYLFNITSKNLQAFQNKNIKVELYMNSIDNEEEILIQNEIIQFRTTKKFIKDENFDLIFITNQNIKEIEYKFYFEIFGLLSLKYSIFDLEFEKIIDSKNNILDDYDSSKFDWLDESQGKIIFFPINNQEFMNIITKENMFTRHFTKKSSNLIGDEYESGFYMFGIQKKQKILESILKEQSEETILSRENEFCEIFYINEPTKNDMDSKINKLIYSYNNDEKSNKYHVYCDQFEPMKHGMFKYSYGIGKKKTYPLKKTHKLVFYSIENYNDLYNELNLYKEYNKNQIKDNEFLLKYNFYFGKTKIYNKGLLSTISNKKKLKMLFENNNELKLYSNFKETPINELIISSIYHDLKNEFFYVDQGYVKLKNLLNETRNNSNYLNEKYILNILKITQRLLYNVYYKSNIFRINNDLSEKYKIYLLVIQEFNTFCKDSGLFSNFDNLLNIAIDYSKDSNRLFFENFISKVIFPLK